MNFKSRSEAYSYAISYLTHLKTPFLEDVEKCISIEICIEKIKIAFENHEQDVILVSQAIKELIKNNIDTDDFHLTRLAEDLEQSDYTRQTLQEKFENPLARRAESEFAIALLLNPTEKMMEAVGRISAAIIRIIEDLENEDDLLLIQFLSALCRENDKCAFGGFTAPPPLEELNLILNDNRPDQLTQIILIHYTFARVVLRSYPIQHAPYRQPIEPLAQIIKNHWHHTADLRDYFGEQGIGAFDEEGLVHRKLISDVLFYESPLYTAEDGRRGRLAELDESQSFPQMGLLLSKQFLYATDLPYSLPWVADCKAQAPNLDSRYVRDAIENDAVYVSGPSGITSLLLGQMEMLGNFENIQLKQHYLAATAAYIVSGGLHSLHEVIGPAQYVLGLVPGYPIQVPGEKDLVEPPQYHVFYELQSEIDREFAERIDIAWEKYINFFNKHYLPRSQHLVTQEKAGLISHSFFRPNEPVTLTYNKEKDNKSSLNI